VEAKFTKFTKMGDSLPWTPMNRRAKFDAASFNLGGEIRNRQTNKQTHTKNSKRHSRQARCGSCLSTCVDIQRTRISEQYLLSSDCNLWKLWRRAGIVSEGEYLVTTSSAASSSSADPDHGIPPTNLILLCSTSGPVCEEALISFNQLSDATDLVRACTSYSTHRPTI